MSVEMITLYFIHAMTGCTCCSDENFIEGPYFDKDEADTIVEKWQAGIGNPLASQYSRYGQYKVVAEEAEPISGNRFIIADTVWHKEIDRHSMF